MMNKFFSQIILNDTETDIAFVIVEDESYIVNTYNFETKQMTIRLTATSPIHSLIWLDDKLLFLQKGELKMLHRHEQQPITITTCEQFVRYAFGVAYLQNGKVHFVDVSNLSEHQLLTDTVEKLYAKGGTGFIVQKDEKQFAFINGSFIEIPLAANISSAAVSFDAQYVAFFAEQFGMTQLFVKDIAMNVVQNMTEMLGETIGNTLTAQAGGSILTPEWTETNAFYFLVTANHEVRLYYGDLYGTLLPASPEDEKIYTFAIARSGNWAVTGLETQNGEQQLLYLDITTGEQQLIFTL